MLDAKDNSNQEYRRNLLKEKLQIYVLNFVYTSKYKDLIFTGGTCLRKFYNLPRISEDLDFNYINSDFNFEQFQIDLTNYFARNIGFKNFSLKFNGRTILIKFPILREVGFAGTNESDFLYLKLDFALVKNGTTQNKAYINNGFSFIAKCYDLNTLFINKVGAYLNGVYKKGSLQTESFKGRDAFDVYWFVNEGVKIGLDRKLITKKIVKEILDKSRKIKPNDLFFDLSNFFGDQKFIRQFCDNYQELIENCLNQF